MKVGELCMKLGVKYGARERSGPTSIGLYWTYDSFLEPDPFHTILVSDRDDLSREEVDEITTAVELHRVFGGQPISGGL